MDATLFGDNLICDMPVDEAGVEPSWLTEWSPDWSSGSEVEFENLRLLSTSPDVSEHSMLSDDMSLFADEPIVETDEPSLLVPKAEPIDAADAAEQTPVVKPSGRAGKKVKREGGASRASPKPTARKQAPAAAHAAAAATAAARSGSFFDILTDEERGLMEQEGITVPKKGPLSKASERELKRLRRQVKNKYSAKDSRKKRKEYMDGLAQANADLADQLTASRRDASALRSKLRGVQSLFRPAAKASVGVASKTRKSAVLLLCLLFSRQHGLDLGSMTGLSDLNLTTSADSPPLDSWSTDEGTASPMEEEEEEDDSSLPKWMSKCVDRIPGVSTLSDARAFGVFETARKAAMEYLRKDDPLALVVAPSAPFKSEEVTGWPLTPERHTAVQ